MNESAPPPDNDNADAAADGGNGTTEAAETPEQRLATLEADNKALHDRLLRLAAEFDNWKKRAKKEMDDAAPRARDNVVKELLPALDNLQRAIAHATADDPLAVGVKMVEKQLLGALEKFQITRFASVGQTFDPAVHEAIQQVETDEATPGTVCQEFAAGYMSGTRLLRAAMVGVAKPAGAAGTES
jgi:molecular chaperone GrpE